MATAIQNFERLKEELQSLKAITTIDVQQLEYAEGGKQNLLIFHGLNKTDMGVVAQYFIDNMAAVLVLIRKSKRLEVEAARIAALAESNAFTAANQAVTV